MGILSRLSTKSPHLPDFGVFWVSVDEAAQILAADLIGVRDLTSDDEAIVGISWGSSQHAAIIKKVSDQLLGSIRNKELRAETVSKPADANIIAPQTPPIPFVRLEDLHAWLGKHQYPHSKWPFLQWSFYELVRNECLLEREVVEWLSRYRRIRQMLEDSGQSETPCDDDRALTTALDRIEELEAALDAAKTSSESSEPLDEKERNSIWSLIAGMYQLLRNTPSVVSRIEEATEQIGCHISKNNIIDKIDKALSWTGAEPRKTRSQLRSI